MQKRFFLLQKIMQPTTVVTEYPKPVAMAAPSVPIPITL